MSASINPRSTAAVDNRSSHSAIGNSVSLAKLRAKARVDCARGPSEPSMLTGRPSTKPMALRSAASARTRAASAANFVRAMVSTPVASLRSGSLEATPMVFVPRSRPINEPRAQSTRAFARNFAKLTELPIALWDDRLSTAAVERGLIEADMRRNKRKEVIDQHAAAYILQGALDRLARLKSSA